MNWAKNFMDSVEHAHGAAYAQRIERECRDELQARRDLTMARVQRIASAGQHLRHVATGEIDMVARFDIPLVDYHGWAMKFADKDGNPNYACWRDPEFLAEYWRDNPELRCAEGKRMDRIVVPGSWQAATPHEYVTVPVPKAAAEIMARPVRLDVVPRMPNTSTQRRGETEKIMVEVPA